MDNRAFQAHVEAAVREIFGSESFTGAATIQRHTAASNYLPIDGKGSSVGKIIVRDSLPDDPIFAEGVQRQFRRVGARRFRARVGFVEKPPTAGRRKRVCRRPRGCLGCFHFAFDGCAVLLPSDRKVIVRLQVHPELCACSEVATKPQSGFRRYRAIATHDVRDPVSRDSQLESERIRGEVTRCKLGSEGPAWMDRRHLHAAGEFEDLSVHRVHAPTLSVRVGDLHLVGIAISKLEDDPPSAVHVDGPEI
jgi:hypothetical protein